MGDVSCNQTFIRQLISSYDVEYSNVIKLIDNRIKPVKIELIEYK